MASATRPRAEVEADIAETLAVDFEGTPSAFAVLQ